MQRTWSDAVANQTSGVTEYSLSAGGPPEEGEVRMDVIARLQSAIMSLHGLLSAQCRHHTGCALWIRGIASTSGPNRRSSYISQRHCPRPAPESALAAEGALAFSHIRRLAGAGAQYQPG